MHVPEKQQTEAELEEVVLVVVVLITLFVLFP